MATVAAAAAVELIAGGPRRSAENTTYLRNSTLVETNEMISLVSADAWPH